MATKTYPQMTVQEAALYMDLSPEEAKRLFDRYVKTARKRLKVFQAHEMTTTKGAIRLKSAYQLARQEFSAENFSYLANTLASERSSYTGEMRVRKKSLETLNKRLSELDDEGNITKPFLRNLKELAEFGDIMDLLDDSVLGKIYDSERLVYLAHNIMGNMHKSKMSFDELKQRFYEWQEQHQGTFDDAIKIFQERKNEK